MIICIDGPAASGKSTTAKIVAQKLSLMYIDTGAMYRAVALYSKLNNINIECLQALESMMESMKIEFKLVDNISKIYLNGSDVTEEIRTPEITILSSKVATIKIVRQKMVEAQRILSQNNNVILDGRDIGTVVFPNAEFKFFLTASVDERALRRYKENLEKGIDSELEQIKLDLIWRDSNDTNRAEAPLKKADDAIEINTTKMTVEEQVNKILKVIKEGIE